MALDRETTLAKITTAITQYRAIGLVQKLLLKKATTTGSVSVAATSLLSLFRDSSVWPLLMGLLPEVRLEVLSEGQQELVAPVQDVLQALVSQDNLLRNAVEEAKSFLPLATVDILKDYSQTGDPLESLGVAVFIIVAANLQE